MNIEIVVDLEGTGKILFNRVEKFTVSKGILKIGRVDDVYTSSIPLTDIRSITYTK